MVSLIYFHPWTHVSHKDSSQVAFPTHTQQPVTSQVCPSWHKLTKSARSLSLP